jgi:hypothetical protein
MDPTHFAYSSFATSARQRRDNLRASAQTLKANLERTRRERDKVLAQLNGSDDPSPYLKARPTEVSLIFRVRSSSTLICRSRSKAMLSNSRIIRSRTEARSPAGVIQGLLCGPGH